MPDPIERLLGTQGVVVLDGALATELERRGADLRDSLWSAKCLLERPELIQAVHADYFAAGADVATTATYQASFEGFQRRGLSHAAAAKVMRDAVGLAVAARDSFWSEPAHRIRRERPLVAASIGPYGAMLADGSEYRGHYAQSDRELADFHRPRLDVLAASGADVLACETLPCLREALVLARLLDGFPTMSAWISFSCQDAHRNSEGEEIAECAAALQDFPQVVAVGLNCTAPQHVTGLLRRMRDTTNKPLVAYPNSGERYDATAKRWCGDPGSWSFAGRTAEWYDSGARLIGGCCRTTPDDIAGIHARHRH